MLKTKKRLLLLSYAFAPSVGGIETVSEILASEMPDLGYEVTVLTNSRTEKGDHGQTFKIIRCPSSFELIHWIRWAHVVLQSNTSIRLAWPLYSIFRNKPFLLVHHTPICQPSGKPTWRDKAKLHLLRRPHSFAVSSYMAGTMPVVTKVVPNPFADDIFRVIPEIQRSQDLIFVGRLSQAKGIDILFHALKLLLQAGESPHLSIVGSGPEEGNLRKLAAELKLDEQVVFCGTLRGEELARRLNQHRILIIPSRPQPPEAFGIVALEGIACGCAVVGSDHGGLPESIGPCGILFKNEDPASLADSILQLMKNPSLCRELHSRATTHLGPYKKSAVLRAYDELIQHSTKQSDSRRPSQPSNRHIRAS